MTVPLERSVTWWAVAGPSSRVLHVADSAAWSLCGQRVALWPTRVPLTREEFRQYEARFCKRCREAFAEETDRS